MKKIIDFVVRHKLFFIVYFITLFLVTVKLPYYIDAPGGLINVSNRIQVDGGYESEGSLNLAYVSEYPGTIPMILLSYIIPDWDLYPKEKGSATTASYEDILLRDRLWMEQAYANAVIVAYQKAGKEVTVTDKEVFVLQLYQEADTDLKAGDIIKSFEDEPISSAEDLSTAIQKCEVGEEVHLTVTRNSKEYTRKATILEVSGQKLIGVILGEINHYEANPAIDIYYGGSESGPSGGLMVSLAVYNAITKEDITGGKTIVGTGTLDLDGNVGEIDGVDYKLKGAVHKKADIFFVPSGRNYEEAMAIKKEKNYKITIVPVSHFDEALEYLKENA